VAVRDFLLKRGVKALIYRPLSILVQIIGLGFLTGTWKWSLGVLGINVIVLFLYYGYDTLWERFVTPVSLRDKVKWTLKSRPKEGLLPRKVRAAIDLLRPATLLPAAVVGTVGARVVGLDWPLSIVFGLTLVCMQGGGQALNQSNPTEVKLDLLNKKDYRPTVAGVLSTSEARAIAYGFLATGVAFAAVAGVWWLGLFMASTAVLYTQEPFYLKRFFPANLLVQAAGRGFLPIFTLGWLSGKDTLPLAVFFAIWVFALQSTKDFGDAMGDKAFGVKTLPVLLGKKNAKFAMLGITILDYGFALATGMWYLLVISPLDVSAILTCEKDWKVVENSVGWALYYTSLGIGTVIGLAFL
jgi:4-hydroxybenzoate polyprenyltransferase